MGRLLLLLTFCIATASAQQPASAHQPAAPAAEAPLPDIHNLLLDVERNQKSAEALQNQYTYHVHSEERDFDGKGNLKKTEITDSESISIDGVRIDRVVARDGKPLTPDEAAKESKRIDKAVAKAKEHRESREAKGEDTDARGDQLITASRILELGSFTNPRRVLLNGRSTIVVDYAGDPNAKTRNSAEGMIRDIVGTVWIDEADRSLVRGQGRFLNDFKIAGGLFVDIHQGLTFDFRTTKVNGEVWLPAEIEGHGSARILLFAKISGDIHLTVSDYRKFRTSSTIIPTGHIIGPDGKPQTPPETVTPKP